MEIKDQIGFDNEKYLQEQTASILERVNRFNHKLYIEFGGKILYDYHAARVLPGFDPNVKMRLLQMLKDKIDVILCINAGDIERKKIRADFGIAYDSDALKSIDDFIYKENENKTNYIFKNGNCINSFGVQLSKEFYENFEVIKKVDRKSNGEINFDFLKKM